MLRETAKRFKVLILVLTLLSASVIDTRAESASIHDATAVQETPQGMRSGRLGDCDGGRPKGSSDPFDR
jgi:hypothetical protein